MSTRAFIDEHDIVFVYEGDTLRMFMHRRDYDQIRLSLNLPPHEPEPVTSGGSILYGLPCARGSNAT